MRSKAPALMPIFRSQHMAEIAAAVLLHPEREYSATDLARFLDLPVSTVHREVERLLSAGIFQARHAGRTKLLRVNGGNRATRSLTELLTVTLGPHVVIGEEFAAVPRAEIVLIFGSWAKRYHGQAGAAPNDVDVLIVGDVDRADVYDAADNASRRLDMPVNPTVSSRTRWDSVSDPLIQEVRASPVVVLHGDVNEDGGQVR